LRLEVGRIERKLLELRARLDLVLGVAGAAHPPVAGQICFFATADLVSTAQFYGEKVGLTTALEREGCRVYQVAASAYLGFCLAGGGTGPPAPAWPVATILTADVDGWYAHLSGRGVTIDTPPQADKRLGAYHFFICDPNGYRLEIRLWEKGGLRGQSSQPPLPTL
jgi:hypothetical protein